MSPTLDAFLRSWPFEPWLLCSLLLTAGIYLRGWLALYRSSHNGGRVREAKPMTSGALRTEREVVAQPNSVLRRLRETRHFAGISVLHAPYSENSGLYRQNQQRWRAGQPWAFCGGLALLYLALASPIEPFAALLLQVHMLQHLLLMMAVPPLCWLGEPMLPLLRGLPQPVRTYWVAPALRWPALRALFARLTHPAAALTLFVAATWLWHAPAAYELVMRSSGWHYVQHACFLATGLLFWYPVVRPFPAHPRWSLWLLLPYLIVADVQNTILSALLTFSNHILYPYYAQIPRLGRFTALEDQSAAGVLMWVPGSVAFLVPLFAIGARLLYGAGSREHGARSNKLAAPNSKLPTPHSLLPAPCPPDLLHVPLIGRFLRWRHARLAMQAPLGALAGVLIFDGLRGPQVGAMNLAGVLPWIHWRGLLIVCLLAAGNFFCTACPFLLPRTLARRWLPKGRQWPRWLRSKWLSVALIVIFFWAYEAFSLWDRPWWTAWIAIGYFVAAFVIDGFFRDAAFCKYVCPIGQFNFVQSLVSPLEVKVRDAGVCESCRTKDCIRGRDSIPGCELHLFQPRKTGNMDCTFCLDCVHACPHHNVGILARPPASELWHEPASPDASSFGKRPDLAVLIVILVFGAFVNAAGMVAPVLAWRDALGSLLRQQSPLLATSFFFIFGLLVLPLAAVGGAAVLSRRWGRLAASWSAVAARYAYALVPLGFSMWLAHYSFHLLTSYDTVVPATQRFAQDLGWSAFGSPHWVAGCCRRVADWLPRLEIVFLDVGLLLSLYTGYRVSRAHSPTLSRALWALAPWALLMALLFAAGIWLIFQPMQMRGTLQA